MHCDAMAPVIINDAEKSALNANVGKEGNPQRTEMQGHMGGDQRRGKCKWS